LNCFDEIERSLNISDKVMLLARRAEEICEQSYKRINDIKGYNQIKVLNAFRKYNVAPMHFAPTYGYGYSDMGREKLESLFCELFGTEAALVRPQIASGTHALGLALYGILRAGDKLVSISGAPYDTLEEIIGIGEAGADSLVARGVEYSQIELKDGGLDYAAIELAAGERPRMMTLQRSRGYCDRKSISIDQMKKAFDIIKKVSPETVIMVDNCYGEFVDYLEPTQVGADIAVGSLIKNIGGGIAPTGGYIVGRQCDIESISYRLTTPGIGGEVGSYATGYIAFFQGLYLAPGAVCEALKGAAFTAAIYSLAGFDVSPKYDESRSCIIQTIRFNNSQELIAFIQSIQVLSPIESNVLPEPWDMPGYRDPVIMAAGTFIQGSSIELSADAPIREPYIAFMQGGLASEQVKAAAINHLNGIIK